METLRLLVVPVIFIGIAIFALWLSRNRLSIKYKMVSLCLTIGLSALFVIGWVGINKSTEAMIAQQESSLAGSRDDRKSQIEDYFRFIDEQMLNFSQNRMITEATAKFSEAFDNVPEQTKIDTTSTSTAYQSVKGYYTGIFKPKLEKAGQPWRGTEMYIPASASGRILQSLYISENPNKVGEKLNLDRATQDCDYNKLHAIYHPRIRQFLESFMYYDIFLFDLKGNLVYSVFKETDYATNFLTGPYKDTNFANVIRKCLAMNKPNQFHIEDFRSYEPSYGAPASFIGAPVFHEGKKVGVAVFQMPVDKINSIMTAATGLGESGQTYLVGKDSKMRCASRFDADTILRQDVETAAVSAALEGKTGTVKSKNYSDTLAVATYAPLDLSGLNWVIVAEMDHSEVTAKATSLRNRLILIAGVLAGLIAATGYFFSVYLIKPVDPIVVRAEEIAAGDLSGVDLSVKSNDELGRLTVAVNEMSDSLRTLVTDVRSSVGDVTATATEIASTSEQMASNTSRQSNDTTQVSAAIEQMSSTVDEVARQSSEAASNASTAGQQAREGGDVVKQTVESMREISKVVTESAVAIGDLGKRGEQIGEIINVINDIADQTNLLALNAAIEAARAGEHGRGFAVVADEVRKLAERTTQATTEVADSINAIQSETKTAVERMNAGTESVQRGVSLAENAGESLQSIVEGANQVAKMIESIASASVEQASATDEIARNVETINTVARQSTDATNQSARSAADLSTKAEQLQALIGRFKLDWQDRQDDANKTQETGSVDAS